MKAKNSALLKALYSYILSYHILLNQNIVLLWLKFCMSMIIVEQNYMYFSPEESFMLGYFFSALENTIK